MSGGRVLSIIASVAMIGAVLAGFYVMGSPTQQRKRHLDNQRVLALSMMSNSIHLYWSQHGALPSERSAISIDPRWQNDPITDKPYAYSRMGEDSYSLCANFEVASDGEDTDEPLPHMYVPTGDRWKHPAGAHCFRFLAENQGGPSE
jgi:hypothetical protein